MSRRDGVRRAETLRRVAETQQRQARVLLAHALRALDDATVRVRDADEMVRRVREDGAVSSGPELAARQARLLAAAQARADLVRARAQAEADVAHARSMTVAAAVQLRGRERLLGRRVVAWQEHVATVEQRALDDVPGRRGKW